LETLTITKEDARRLKDILDIFNHARSHLIQEGSMKIDNVTLEWNNDIIRVSIKDPPPGDEVAWPEGLFKGGQKT